MKPTDSIRTIKGIGEKSEKLFYKLGISTVGELLNFFPREYDIFTPIQPIQSVKEGEVVIIEGSFVTKPHMANVRNLKILSCQIKDTTAQIRVSWFNMPFLMRSLKMGMHYILRGRIVLKNGMLQMTQPKILTREEYSRQLGKMMPVYPLTAGLTNHAVTKAVTAALKGVEWESEFLPAEIRKKYELILHKKAIQTIHFPDSKKEYIIARKRLVFEEFFLFSLALHRMKELKHSKPSSYPVDGDVYDNALLEILPYELTSGQFCAYLEPLGIRIGLLTGSMTAVQKRKMYQKTADQEVDILVGTHALIQEKVEYANLALIVTDEQHRFGVRQRELFSEKGKDPHMLVMSATPIPRTLAIILYGDLDVSVIDVLPANRLPIKNCAVGTNYRPQAYRFMEKEVREGHQVYIICPMVEESENTEAENVLDYTNSLKDMMPRSIRIEYLHGKLKPAQKNEIMASFAAHQIDILVSTTVIEVGINVPNATVMMIENAERFGLAQLHQLRGRVGRGSAQSYCIFMAGNASKETMERLRIIEGSNDGFYVAREDLKLRGPGDLFGIRQSGELFFKLADIYQDANELTQANEAAASYTQQDVSLLCKKYDGLRQKLQEYTGEVYL